MISLLDIEERKFPKEISVSDDIYVYRAKKEKVDLPDKDLPLEPKKKRRKKWFG